MRNLIFCALFLAPSSAWAQVDIPPGVDAKDYMHEYKAARENAQNPTFINLSDISPTAFACDSNVKLKDGEYKTGEKGGDATYRLPRSLDGSLIQVECWGDVRSGKASAALTDSAKIPLRSLVAETGGMDFHGKTVLGLGAQTVCITIHLAPNTTLHLDRLALARRVR